MASKVLVPAAPFAKLQVKKSPPESAGFIISGDAAARVTHLEHSVRFLQEQHRLMLSGLHAEIEALRERNRDLQFQLIFNKESSPKPTSPANEENPENSEEAKLKREVARLEREAASARSEARAAEARALQLQRLVDAQAEKLRELEIKPKCAVPESAVPEAAPAAAGESAEEAEAESRRALRARLADAERLVRRLRGEAERRRRELQCMKNSMHASLRATGLSGVAGLDQYGYQNNYHFPPVHTPEFWREPMREEFHLVGRGRNNQRPLTLPELSGQQVHRSTVYANHHTRSRANGYENKNKKQQSIDVQNGRNPEEQAECRLTTNYQKLLPNINDKCKVDSNIMYPELQIVVAKMIPHGNVSTGQSTEAGRGRGRRAHRKQAADHT